MKEVTRQQSEDDGNTINPTEQLALAAAMLRLLSQRSFKVPHMSTQHQNQVLDPGRKS